MSNDDEVEVLLLFFTRLNQLTIHPILDFGIGSVQCFKVHLFNDDFRLSVARARRMQLLIQLLVEFFILRGFLLLLQGLLDELLFDLGLDLHFLVFLALFFGLLLLEAHLSDGLLFTVVELSVVQEVVSDLVMRKIVLKHRHKFFNLVFSDCRLFYEES